MADLFIDYEEKPEMFLDDEEMELVNFIAEEMYRVYFRQSNHNINAENGVRNFLDMKLSAIKAFKRKKAISSIPVEGINSEYLKAATFVTKQYIMANTAIVMDDISPLTVEKIAENAFDYKSAALATIAQRQLGESENYRSFK